MGDLIFVTVADFNIEGVNSEVIYVGLDGNRARDINGIIDDYEVGGRFRTMLESLVTTFRLEVWCDGNCIEEATPLYRFSEY